MRRALEQLMVQTTFQGYAPDYQLERLQRLEQRWAAMGWQPTDDVAELFARAYDACGDRPSAIRWYEAAIAAGDGRISFRTLEQLSNLRIRQALREVKNAPAKGKRPAIAAARRTIDAEIEQLTQLSDFEQTTERASLLGSAMKRLWELEKAAGRRAAAQRAVQQMARYYERAVALARERDADNLFYPANNLIAAKLFLEPGGAKLTKALAPLVKEARQSVDTKNERSPDFWSLVAEPELGLYEALLRGTIVKDAPVVIRQFKDVHRRSQGSAQWGSVIDTLRFVVDPYGKRASKPARAAAQRVLDAIEGLAEPPRGST
jgi:hypothetical protein